MIDRLFLDTSGLLCLHDQDDFRHKKAVEYFTEAKRLLTTNYVLTEFFPLSHSRGQNRDEAIAFIDDLLLIPRLNVTWIDEALHNQSVELIKNRQDKDYSLCDAVSFVIMREHKIIAALTTDKHFAREGFIALLK